MNKQMATTWSSDQLVMAGVTAAALIFLIVLEFWGYELRSIRFYNLVFLGLSVPVVAIGQWLIIKRILNRQNGISWTRQNRPKFRYGLRTLMIVLVLGPPALAWMFANPIQIRPAILFLVLYYVIAATIYQNYGPKPNREGTPTDSRP